jgi:hypothetical protein
LKRRYRKWPRIGHLDICSPSYGQKKGRESNCQFDSRPLKVGNRPLPDLLIESAIRRWKGLDAGYKFGSDLVAIRLCSRELWAPKVPGLHPGQFRDNFGTPTRESLYPFLELEAGSVPPSLNYPQLDFVKPSSGFHPVTWEHLQTSKLGWFLTFSGWESNWRFDSQPFFWP